MDPQLPNNQAPQQLPATPVAPPATPVMSDAFDAIPRELAHITEEMYKKNRELTDKNKTLSLLRKIDEIILTSATDPKELANKVTTLLVTELQFKIASIYIHEQDKRKLTMLAISEASDIKGKNNGIFIKDVPYIGQIPLAIDQNSIVQATTQGKHISSSSLHQTFFPGNSSQLIQQYQDAVGIKMCLTYPLIVRQAIIGDLVVCLPEDEASLSEFQKDLLNRLSGVIGIAIDNAILYNEVQQTNQKLQALDKLKDEFVSLASHELRTPMTAIKSYLWMALAGRGGALTDKQRYYIDRAYNSTDRLITLVNDMLNISRIESGRITLEKKSVKIEALAIEVIEEVRPRADELGVKIIVQETPSLPDVVADPDKTKEVFFNLLGNSLKFTPRNGTIIVSFRNADAMVEVNVADTGIGLAKDDLTKLFQKFGFIPGSYTINQSAQGTGLGLYICKSIVEMQGGRIWASSEGKGKGATFTFSLRKVTEKDLQAFNSAAAPKPQAPVNLIHTGF